MLLSGPWGLPGPGVEVPFLLVGSAAQNTGPGQSPQQPGSCPDSCPYLCPATDPPCTWQPCGPQHHRPLNRGPDGQLSLW